MTLVIETTTAAPLYKLPAPPHRRIGNQTLINCDMRDAIAAVPDNSLGCIIADPPYNNGALPLYRHLLAEAGRVLTPGGNLVVILPQGKLPEVLAYPTPGLTWRWLLTMRQTVGSYPSLCNAMRTVRVQGKAIGWWTKKPWPARDYRHLHDGFDNTPLPRSERVHKWQQSPDWARYCLTNFAVPGLPSLDPMCGAGTTLWVAHELGIEAIGVELDAGTYRLACDEVQRRTGGLL